MKSISQTSGRQFRVKLFVVAVIVSLALLFCPADLWAKPVNLGQAEKAVKGWLNANPRPLGAALGTQLARVDTFTDERGEPAYYVVYLEPAGFVIVPADDLVEPIIAFAPAGSYDPSDDNPLGALVSADVPARVAAARSFQAAAGGDARDRHATAQQAAAQKASAKARAKWGKLEAYDDSVGTNGLSGISDVWVPYFVESTWGQSNVEGYSNTESCYNYYTPPHEPNTNTNYPAGCVATAMAQLMRFHQYPVVGIESNPFTIRVDGVPETAYTRGGNGSGGPYAWTNMVLQPRSGEITPAQREAIGALCYDAGVSVEMAYTSGGSSASLHDGARELRDTFLYTYSVHGYNSYNEIGAARNAMINPNLDAGYPVILGIHRPGGGHAVVCDGYGFDASTPYHHLNMGWDGHDNAWYNLPVVDAYYYYDVVDTCVYNVFTSGSGEIISGRITDPAGAPISGAGVTAVGGGTHNTTSNDNGIYALAKVPSGTTFTVSVSKGAWNFTNQMVTTGTSIQDSTTCGNRWGINFTGTISAGFVELDKETYTATETVNLSLVDTDLLGHGSQAVTMTTTGGDTESVTVSENPSSSGVFTGSIATDEAAPVTGNGTLEVAHGDTITATYYDLDDGTGSPAVSEDTATVIGLPYPVYEADFTGGLPTGWSVIDGYSDGKTWTSTNPGGRANSNWNGTFMIADSDWAGSVNMDEQLITHSIDCSFYEQVSLAFTHYFRYYSGGPAEIGDVDIRVNGGPWQNTTRYENGSYSGQVEINLSALADGQADVQIRWHYYNANWDYYWGIDNVQIWAIEMPHPPVPIDDSVSAQTGAPETITLQASDDGTPGPLSYIICSLPERGTLSDPCGGAINDTNLPYNLSANGDQVAYTSYACYEGLDSFTFKADDGGTPPSGGPSAPATISIDVSAPDTVIYETDFEEGIPTGWTIIDGNSDGYTWFWAESTIDGRKLMVVDSDGAGYVWMDEELITHSIDCSTYDNVRLIFDQLFLHNSVEIADVDVRAAGGSWQNVAHYQGTNKDEITQLDISPVAAGQVDVQIRWHYYDALWDWYWVIYDVQLLGSGRCVTGDFQGDCGVNFHDFAFLAGAWQSTPADLNWDRACDISDPNDDIIDELDLDVFCENWLEALSP